MIKRYLVIGNGLQAETENVEVGNSELVFEPNSVPESGPLAPMSGLQNRMREEEALLAQSLTNESHYGFADGPLTYFSDINQTVFGVIKTSLASGTSGASWSSIIWLSSFV